MSIVLCNALQVHSALQKELLLPQPAVVEHLRILVPYEERSEWIAAEKATWEPWLAKKRGFLGRQLFWDPQSEEATLLISWAKRSDWKSIPQTEINEVQASFERLARESTGKKEGNPFPLQFEGELLPQ